MKSRFPSMQKLLNNPPTNQYLRHRGFLNDSVNHNLSSIPEYLIPSKHHSRRPSQENNNEKFSRLASLGQSSIKGLSTEELSNIIEQHKTKYQETEPENKKDNPNEGFFLTAREEL